MDREHKSFTDEVYKLYESFKESGFDKDQATKLTSIYLMEIKEYDRVRREKQRGKILRNAIKYNIIKENNEEEKENG